MPDRSPLAESARQHIGAPYRHLGRGGRGGFDCLGLLMAALKECGYLPADYEFDEYTENVSEYQLAEAMRAEMDELKDWRGEAEAGDVLLQRFHSSLPASHILIVTRREGAHLWAVHASRRSRRVVEQRVCHVERISHAFRVKECAR